jgi:hypothetical protein
LDDDRVRVADVGQLDHGPAAEGVPEVPGGVEEPEPSAGGGLVFNLRQPDLWDSPLSRAADPQSSRAAEIEAVESGLVAGHERLIVAAVRARPGQTGDEIGAAVGLTNVQVLRRTRAMERRGVIRRGDQRASRVSGRLAVTWWPVEGQG